MSEITFNETINKVKLKYIIEHYEDLVLATPTTNELNQLKHYLKKKRGKITYSTLDKNGRDCSRLFAKDFGLQRMRKEIRNTIAEGLYYCIDMKNAMPTIMYQWCQYHEFDAVNLGIYVNQRDEILQLFLKGRPDSDPKTEILSMMNGGSMDLTGLDNYFHDFVKEMKLVRQLIWEKEEALRVPCTVENYFGKTGSRFYFCVETQVMLAIINYLKKKRIVGSTCTPVFDGLLIPIKAGQRMENGKPFLGTLLTEIEAYVLQETYYKIHLEVESMDKVLELPADIMEQDDDDDEQHIRPSFMYEYEKTIIQDGDIQASHILSERHKDVITECAGDIYVKKDGIWLSNKNVVNYKMLQFILNANFYKLDADGDLCSFSFTSNTKSAKDVREAWRAIMPSNPYFLDKIYQTTKGKICFSDGVFDFTTKTFTEGFDGIFSTVKIERPYPKERNEQDIERLKSVILYPILGDFLTPWLQFMARTIAGHVEDKNWYIMMGERNTGKSKLGTLLKATFEKYICTFHSNQLLYNNVTECTRANAFVDEMHFSRLAILNEIDANSSKKSSAKLNGYLIKQLTGNDPICYRKLYDEQINILIQATFILSVNKLPEITPEDCLETLVAFTTPFNFSDDPNEVDNIRVFRKNPDIDSLVKADWAKNALVHLLTDHYHSVPAKPTQLMLEQRSLHENPTEALDWDRINEVFVITGNDQDVVSAKEIRTFFNDNKNLTIAYSQYLAKLTKDKLVTRVKRKGFDFYKGIMKPSVEAMSL